MSVLHNLTALNFSPLAPVPHSAPGRAGCSAWRSIRCSSPCRSARWRPTARRLSGRGGGWLFHLNTHFPLAWKLFAITGFLGGLTTFSTFSAEVVERLLAGQPMWAIGLATLHLAGSLTATYLGLLTVGATRIWS
jgi:CrcB protein